MSSRTPAPRRPRAPASHRAPTPRGRTLLAPAALLLCAACALGGAPKLESEGANPCSGDEQCAGGNVCFLGACRGGATALGLVLVEVRPPGSSPYGTLQRSGLDLRRSVLNDFELTETRIAGTVQQASDVAGAAQQPVAGAQVTFTAADVIIPGRVAGVQVQSGSAGDFSALLPAADQSASFQISALPPAPLPPLRLAQDLGAGGGPLAILLPAPSTLLHATGTATQGGAPLCTGLFFVAFQAGKVHHREMLAQPGCTGCTFRTPLKSLRSRRALYGVKLAPWFGSSAMSRLNS